MSDRRKVTPLHLSHLYPWERRSCRRLFKIQLAKGLALHPELPELDRDRAEFLSYRVCMFGWLPFYLVSLVGLFIAAPLISPGVWRGVVIATCLPITIWSLTVPFLRLRQARKVFANHRHYQLSLELTNWSADAI
jgi:hypothetical protein